MAGSRDIYSIGGPQQQVSVQLDPARLQAYQLSLPQLQQALLQNNSLSQSQALLAPNQQIQLQAGNFFIHPRATGTVGGGGADSGWRRSAAGVFVEM